MKNFLTIFSLSFSLGLSSVSYTAYAGQTSIANYYPSPTGNYTKIHLVNKSGSSIPCDGTNGGTIFTDPTTGYLEVCKSDGTFASYPGSCFNQYAVAIPSSPCPNNYQMVNSTTANFGSGGIVSWSCCFTGQGAGSNSNSSALVTKSGCFSLYSNSPVQPYLCNDTSHGGDANAYDVGCDAISSSDMTSSKPVFKRNCCYNASLGKYILGSVSQCSCPNTCGSGNCGTDPCGDSCGTCPPEGQPTWTTCSSSTAGNPGTCQCTPATCANLGDNCGTPPNGCGANNPSCGNCLGTGQTCGGGGSPFICGADCEGSWSICSDGSQTYTITVPSSGGGTACPFANGATQPCVDCVGSWGPCSGGTETYTITTPASGDGNACPYANGATQSCSSAIDCVGSWGGCSDCNQTYTITTPDSGGGTACPYTNGATRSCGDGGACNTNGICSGGTCICSYVTCGGSCCASGDSCVSGVCSMQPGCIIGGVSYSNGATNPASTCQYCNPSASTTSWSWSGSCQACYIARASSNVTCCNKPGVYTICDSGGGYVSGLATCFSGGVFPLNIGQSQNLMTAINIASNGPHSGSCSGAEPYTMMGNGNMSSPAYPVIDYFTYECPSSSCPDQYFSNDYTMSGCISVGGAPSPMGNCWTSSSQYCTAWSNHTSPSCNNSVFSCSGTPGEDGSCCPSSCGAGEACCAGTCSNTQTDNNNCGGCDYPCQSGSSCSSGSCV